MAVDAADRRDIARHGQDGRQRRVVDCGSVEELDELRRLQALY